MILVLAFIVVSGVGIFYKYRERFGFPYGQLSRRFDQISTKQLTELGTDQFIELSFGKVHYTYRPSNTDSTLNIFVHGFSIPMNVWEDVFLSFVNDKRSCLAYDLYGRGYSDSPSAPMTSELLVSQLNELLNALNLPYEKYNLHGFSMGGVIVQRFAELNPSKISKIVLYASAGMNHVTPSILIMSILSIPVVGPMLFKLIMQRSNNKSVRSQWAYPDKDKYRQYERLFQQTCQQHPGFLRSLFSTLFYFNFQLEQKSIELINKSNIPILIIWGDKDTLIPVENAYLYNKFYENSSLTIIPDGNHSFLIEHSKEIIEALKKFFHDE